MSRPSDSKATSLSELGGINTFLSLMGLLSAAGLPSVLIFLGGDTITQRGSIGAYIGTLAVLSAGFGVFMLADEMYRARNGIAADLLAAAYVTLVVPVVCLLLALTVTLVIPLAGYLFGILLLHIVFFFVWRLGRGRMETSDGFAKMNRLVVGLTPVFYGGIFWSWFCRQYQPHFGRRSFIILIAMAAVFMTFARSERLRAFRLRLRNHWWILLFAGVFLFAIVYQPGLYFDRAHSNPLLAPALDVQAGRTILVDSLSQYGIGSVYFLLAVFSVFQLPVFYHGLAAILTVLYFLQFTVIFLILHKATRSFFIGLAVLGVIVYFSFYAVTWPSLLRIPAQGPLRYGLTYLVLGAGWIGIRHKGRFWQILELVLIGAASVWNLEVFLYTFIPVSVLHFIKDVLFAERRPAGMAAFAKRMLLQLSVVILCWIAWWSATLASAGSPPNLTYYSDIFTWFISIGAEGRRMDFHSFWTGIVAAIYLGSILAAVYAGVRRSRRIPVEMAALMAGLSAAGLLQYLYYFGYDLDFHLALLCPPLLMVVAIWFSISQNDVSARGVPRFSCWSFGGMLVISVWLCMAQVGPRFLDGVKKSFLYQMAMEMSAGDVVTFADPYRLGPTNDTVAALLELTEKYTADEWSIAVFAFPDDQTELLLLTGKSHLLEMTDPVMCSISHSFASRILDLADQYSGVPQFIFYDSSDGVLLDLQQDAFRRLVSAGSYTVVDRIGNVLVYRKA